MKISVNKLCSGIVGITTLGLLVVPLSGYAADLASAKYVPAGGDQGRIVLQFTGDAPQPKAFSVSSPARIALDFAGAGSVLKERKQDFSGGPVKSIFGAASGDRLRLVVSLDKLLPYQVTTDGNLATLWLNQAPQVSQAAPLAVKPQPRTVDAEPKTVKPYAGHNATRSEKATSAAARPQAIKRVVKKAVTGVDFRRGVGGEGRLIVELSDRSVLPNIRTEGSKVFLEMDGVVLSDGVARKYDVVDFGTPVTEFTVSARKREAVVIIDTVGDFEQTAFMAGGQYVVEFHPLTEEEVAAKFPFSGERININFQSIEVRALLEIIADVAGVNIVVSDSVKGSITLRLNDVPWDQALDLVLTTKGLDKREAGNVVYVAPMAEIANREKEELRNALENETLAPLVAQLIPLNYAKAADIETILKTKAGGDNEKSNASLLSERATVSFDERTNTLLIYETKEKLADIFALVRKLDVPVRQVLIESRIVIANKSFSNEVGVRFGVTTAQPLGNGAVGVTGSGTGASQIVENFRTGGFPVAPPSLANRRNVNLPSAAAGTLGLAILSSDYLLDLELSALQAEGKGEIVSNPRVITANQQTASIQQGVEVPFQTVSDAGTSVQFKQATLALEVTPLITPDGRVLMDLSVSKDSIGVQVSNGSGGFIPSIDTRSVETQVLVEDGETVVLGGIYEVTRTKSETKVPVLGDLPILGNLFRNKQVKDEKSELLIFVTPRVLRDGLKADY